MTKTLAFIFLIIVSAISLFPFYILVMMSTHTTTAIFRGEFFLPGSYFINNVQTVLASNFFRFYANSLIVSISSTFLCVLISALAGFALSKYEFKYRSAIYAFILMTMMVPGQIGSIGYLLQMRAMGLNNTLIPLIIVWTTSAFGVFWMTQFIKTAVPTELIESSKIDGCSEIGIFFKMVIPCIRPAIATLSMVVFLWSWNSYMLPLIIVTRESLFTIPLFIATLGTAYRTDSAAQMAGLLLATVPLLIVFILGSKNFIRGLTAGAVKG